MITWYLSETGIIPDTVDQEKVFYLWGLEVLFLDTPIAFIIIWNIRLLLGI